MQYADIKPLISICIERCIPFGVVAFPGSADYKLFASLPDSDTGENNLTGVSAAEPYLALSFFNNEEDYPIGVRQRLSPTDIYALAAAGRTFEGPDIRPVASSTRPIVYDAQVHEIMRRLGRRLDKAVLSRIIAGEAEGLDLAEAAGRYFEQFATAFRFIYYTQETGLWMGASPELLLDIDTDSGAYRTMALAGTRAAGQPGEWDEKNLAEHRHVSRFIFSILHCLGTGEPEVSEEKTVRYGDIEHLCTQFAGRSTELEPLDILRMLSPTPALGGYPREAALQAICAVEAHQRHCYGGYIAVNDPETQRLRAYVNLRCAHLQAADSKIIYNIYTGSGLVKGSTAQAEWQETAAKAMPLTTLLGAAQLSTDGLF